MRGSLGLKFSSYSNVRRVINFEAYACVWLFKEITESQTHIKLEKLTLFLGKIFEEN